MATLAQLLAAREGEKNRAGEAQTRAYHQIQKPEPLRGIARQYTPSEDGGEALPPESTRVQVKVQDLIKEVIAEREKYFDLNASIEWGNCDAKASVEVDGKVIVADVPVTYLLFLEKQLTDLKTFISKLPILDPADEWEYDENQDCYATKPIQTVRNKKVMQNHVKFKGDEHHPPQVETFFEDLKVGTWSTIKYSGCLPAKRVKELLAKVDVLQKAVKMAREAANSTNAPKSSVGRPVFEFIFAE